MSLVGNEFSHNPVVYAGEDAPGALVAYAQAEGLQHLTLIADTNTYAALGQRVEASLRAARFDVTRIVVEGLDPVVADELRLVRVILAAPSRASAYVAAGSGTITDIARFASFHSRNRFISLPSAASMDGYATSNNTLTLDKLKISVRGHAPEAIFCDLPALAAAPRAMTAAGLGDILARFTSVNDLRLGHLLWGERSDTWDRDAPIADRMERLGQTALVRGGEIAAGEPKALAFLMAALIDSGLAMADFGNSMPGSGSEHHISHCWEMRAQMHGEPALFHGAKVGVATVMAAGWYAAIREMTQREAADRLAATDWPDPQAQIADIRRVYGPIADELIEAQRPFLYVTPEQWADLKWRILDHWDEVRAIAAQVAQPAALADVLAAAGGPGWPQELGLSGEEIEIGARYGHYTRPRFTIAKLRLLLGI
ncbi:MAG: iron-containing alcohol dehydrogenase [Nitrososphaerales archaeon]